MSAPRWARKSGLSSASSMSGSQPRMQVSQLPWGSADVKMPLPSQRNFHAQLLCVCQLELEFLKTDLALETWMEAICGEGIK